MKVKNDILFIGEVTEGRMVMHFQMKPNVCTLGNVKILIETAHLYDTCRFTLSEKAHLLIEGVETFLK